MSSSEKTLPHGYLSGGIAGHYQGLNQTNAPTFAFSSDDERWMHAALTQSMHAAGISSPNPPVGCVLVKDGQMIGKGHTSEYGKEHAEVNALKDLSDASFARGATAYVTLEPCPHVGKQGPCAEALVRAGISRCVIAVKDPNPLVSGLGIQKLIAAGIEVCEGVLEAPCAAFLLPFLVYITENRPFIALKWAQTLDAHLADDLGNSQWISGALSREYTHWLRHRYDAILVGAGTVIKDLPKLNVRSIASDLVKRQPLRVLLDPKGRLLELDLERQKEFVAATLSTDQLTAYIGEQKPKWLAEVNANVHFETWNPLKNEPVMKHLAGILKRPSLAKYFGKPIQSVLIEGGPKLLNFCLQEHFYDVAHVFISPSFMGGSVNRLGGYAGEAQALMASYERNQCLASYNFDGDILVELIRAGLSSCRKFGKK